MSFPTRFTIVLFSVALCATAIPAQQPLPQNIPPANPHSNRMQLDVVVTPRSGPPVAGLHKEDFTVLDNSVDQPITYFEPLSGPQAPEEVILLIDAVNTNFSNIAFERNQIEKFLKSNGGHLAHPVSLAIFTDAGIEIQQGPSLDGNQLSASLHQFQIGLREIRRSSVYGSEDRFDLSIKTLQSMVAKEAARPGRKIIFWISPGWPLLSSPRIQLDARQQQQIYSEITGISTALRHGDITLYSIDPLGTGQNVEWEFDYEQFLKGVKNPGQVQLGNLALQVLAVQSGGLALSASNDIVAQLQKCMTETTAYYRIAYDAPPPEHPDEYHPIAVKVSGPGLTARTRTGYYAAP